MWNFTRHLKVWSFPYEFVTVNYLMSRVCLHISALAPEKVKGGVL